MKIASLRITERSEPVIASPRIPQRAARGRRPRCAGLRSRERARARISTRSSTRSCRRRGDRGTRCVRGAGASPGPYGSPSTIGGSVTEIRQCGPSRQVGTHTPRNPSSDIDEMPAASPRAPRPLRGRRVPCRRGRRGRTARAVSDVAEVARQRDEARHRPRGTRPGCRGSPHRPRSVRRARRGDRCPSR